jgi:hypothetical protein
MIWSALVASVHATAIISRYRSELTLVGTVPSIYCRSQNTLAHCRDNSFCGKQIFNTHKGTVLDSVQIFWHGSKIRIINARGRTYTNCQAVRYAYFSL